MKRGKYFIVAFILVVLFVVFSACDSSDNTSARNHSKSDNNISQSSDESTQSNDSTTDSTLTSDKSSKNNDEQSANSSGEMEHVDSEINESNVGDEGDKETLSHYSNEQIEYARVWLLLGENQKIEELNVTKILEGTPINPNDKTSATYPVDVIQLSGSRLIDGSVTYSGNGDGTINVYNVPLRWESNVPEDLDEDYMAKYTQSIIEDAKLVYVDPGNDDEVIELIKILNEPY